MGGVSAGGGGRGHHCYGGQLHCMVRAVKKASGFVLETSSLDLWCKALQSLYKMMANTFNQKDDRGMRIEDAFDSAFILESSDDEHCIGERDGGWWW